MPSYIYLACWGMLDSVLLIDISFLWLESSPWKRSTLEVLFSNTDFNFGSAQENPSQARVNEVNWIRVCSGAFCQVVLNSILRWFSRKSGRQGLLLGYMKLEMNFPGGESAPHALFRDLKYETPKKITPGPQKGLSCQCTWMLLFRSDRRCDSKQVLKVNPSLEQEFSEQPGENICSSNHRQMANFFNI